MIYLKTECSEDEQIGTDLLNLLLKTRLYTVCINRVVGFWKQVMWCNLRDA